MQGMLYKTCCCIERQVNKVHPTKYISIYETVHRHDTLTPSSREMLNAMGVAKAAAALLVMSSVHT